MTCNDKVKNKNKKMIFAYFRCYWPRMAGRSAGELRWQELSDRPSVGQHCSVHLRVSGSGQHTTILYILFIHVISSFLITRTRTPSLFALCKKRLRTVPWQNNVTVIICVYLSIIISIIPTRPDNRGLQQNAIIVVRMTHLSSQVTE